MLFLVSFLLSGSLWEMSFVSNLLYPFLQPKTQIEHHCQLIIILSLLQLISNFFLQTWFPYVYKGIYIWLWYSIYCWYLWALLIWTPLLHLNKVFLSIIYSHFLLWATKSKRYPQIHFWNIGKTTKFFEFLRQVKLHYKPYLTRLKNDVITISQRIYYEIFHLPLSLL